jgi:hypothetical protein
MKTPELTPELADFDPTLVSDDYDFFATESGQLHLQALEDFGKLFEVPNEWLKPEFVDHRCSDDHTPIELIDGKVHVVK